MCMASGMVVGSRPAANQATSSPKLRPCTRLLRRIGGRIVHTLFMCTVGTFCSQAEVMEGRHFPSRQTQYVGGLASQKACGVQEWRRRWIACTPSCRP